MAKILAMFLAPEVVSAYGIHDDMGAPVHGAKGPDPLSGRPAWLFSFPEGLENSHGLTLRTFDDIGLLFDGKGMLLTEYPDGSARWLFDDLERFKRPAPPPCPEPEPEPEPDPTLSAKSIADAVYASQTWTLTTKEGCGQFTEAVCTALHEEQSEAWGHIKKTGSQNQYNGHAVDAIHLLTANPGCPVKGTYDIVVGAGDPDAKYQWNKGHDSPDESWYYPAAARG